MSDKELIKLIAKTWIDNGGDVDGFCYSYHTLISAIKEEIESKTERNLIENDD